MAKYKLEYLWLDGYTPVANIRGKTKIAEFDDFPTLDQLDDWGFDGSSTQQADGGDSDCILKPNDSYDNNQLAALTIVGNVLLNLDEFLMKR